MAVQEFFIKKRKAKTFLFTSSIFASGILVLIFFLFATYSIIQKDGLLILVTVFIILMICMLYYLIANIKKFYSLSYGGKPIFIFTSEGLINNSSALYNENILIEWQAINFIECRKMSRSPQQLFLIYLFDPQQFIKINSNPIFRFMIRFNKFSYGSPIVIGSILIDKNIINAFEEYGFPVANKENFLKD